MAHRIEMPPLGQTTDELVIVEWFKKEGDPVRLGEPLLSVLTDKAQVDVESVAAGTLLRVLCAAGETVRAGSPVAYVGTPGEVVPDSPAGGADPGEPEPAGTTASAAASATAAPASPGLTSAPPAQPERRPAGGGGGRVAALPAARQRAGELGVDLSAMVGTGPGGAITVGDVELAGAEAPAAAEAAELIAVPPLRQVIARRMTASAQRIPQFTLTASADVSAARELVSAQRAEGGATPAPSLTYTHLILRAVATALRELPAVNRLWIDDGPRFRQLRRSDVGLAVACDDGLRVVRVPEPDQAPLTDLPGRAGGAAARARSGSLLQADRLPVAVTVSNLGMHGVERFQALVDPDQTAVLAVGAVEERPAVRAGALVILPMVELSLSVDHRVVDGALAAQFLQAIRGALESPVGGR